MTGRALPEQDVEDAVQRGRTRAASDFRAKTVTYRADQDAIEIVTTEGAGFIVPRLWIEPLVGLSPRDLSHLEVWPGGAAFELPDHDVHVSVNGLLSGVLPKMVPVSAMASIFGRAGGTATSTAKRATAKRNGAKGGRPRKTAAAT